MESVESFLLLLVEVLSRRQYIRPKNGRPTWRHGTKRKGGGFDRRGGGDGQKKRWWWWWHHQNDVGTGARLAAVLGPRVDGPGDEIARPPPPSRKNCERYRTRRRMRRSTAAVVVVVVAR